MGIVEQYLLQLNTAKQRFRRAIAILTALSLLVVLGVSWNLRLTGITLANDASCGQEEHQHTGDCPKEALLICGYPSETDAVLPVQTTESIELKDVPETIEETYAEETAPAHIHSDDCYEVSYICTLEEHIHVLSCYSDISADIETPSGWEAALPQLTENWAENLVLIARSQAGCCESERNYVLAEDGQTRKGITRFGQWYGNPYGDWSAMFTMFCLHYAGIPEEAIPWSPGEDNMMRLAQNQGILSLPDEAMGLAGNILFVDTDANEKADKLLIVTDLTEELLPETDVTEEQAEETELTQKILIAIGGDWDNAVSEVTFPVNDPCILGYIPVEAVQSAYRQAQSTAPAPDSQETTAVEETIPEELTEATEETEIQEEIPAEEEFEEQNLEEAPSGEPEILLDVEFLEHVGMMRLQALTVNVDDAAYFWQWQVSEDGNEPWVDIEGAESFLYELPASAKNESRYYRIQGRRIEPEAVTFAIRSIAVTEEENGTITSGGISPLSIGKTNNNYLIDVYAIPVDASGNRIAEIGLTYLERIRINSTAQTAVKNIFDTNLGIYQSAYFGTESAVSVDNIDSVWRYRQYNWGSSTYYLAYSQTNGTQNQRWKSAADNSISLYLRYIPQFTVTFESEGFNPMAETVSYNGYPTLTEPGYWTRADHTLVGWIIDQDQQNLYTYEQLLQRPVVADVTYRAQWKQEVNIHYNVGQYADLLDVIPVQTIAYGTAPDPYPTPSWKNNSVAMAFDGWYLDQDLTQPVTADHVFYEDTTLYAKWVSKDNGFYIYFMDFKREDQTPLVLMTNSVTEGRTTAPYTPGNAPQGTEWDGKWYLDRDCTQVYDFRIPVSQMTDYLTGANGRDLYLYPGTQAVCRAIFVTYGTKVDPVTVPIGNTINLDQFIPERDGYTFAGWTLKDGTPVSGQQVLNETTTFYATWEAGYVPFEAILRIENANDTGMTQAEILGTWYAKAGSRIRVNSTYTGTGDNRTGTHRVVCVLDGVEYPVYSDAALTRQATLSDVYATYFIYNNSGTTWTDEVNWDDVYTGGELPYSTRPVSSAGDTIINFDYMRVRNDIVFTIPNGNSGGYMDVYSLYQKGLITGAVTYTGTKPTGTGSNVSATGVSATNVSWSYTAASGTNGNNLYTLHDMKYGQRIFEVYPVGTSWLTLRNSGVGFHQYRVGSGQLFASRREDLSAAFFSGSGRRVKPYSLTAEFVAQEQIALMYAIECLSGETADFTINGKGYKVQTQLCEVVNHTGGFGIKELLGCEPGVNVLGTNDNNNYFTKLHNTTATVNGTSVRTLFGVTYGDYYKTYVSDISDIDRAYIFYYDRLYMNIQFSFAYDSDGDGANEMVEYENIAFGENISEYQFGEPGFGQHQLLEREGYEFVGWLDANGFVLEADDWTGMVASGDSEDSAMIFIAKWEKISNNIVEYYEDVSATTPFESHYFEDGAMLEYPTMTVYPEGWVWQEYGEGRYERFDWDVPMYGEYGVQEVRQNSSGEDVVVNVVRIYGTWDESHTRVVYDPNAAQGGIPGTAPEDSNEYTIWQSEVPVMPQGSTANMDPEAVFVGWQLDRNGVVYQPGDHVPVHWPRTMIFMAQWAKPEDVVYLRYHPNGGTPEGCYPNENGFSYRRNATAAVWDNTASDGAVWFDRIGYTFVGWNTEPDGSGTAYEPDSTILLTEPLTTLYAQWQKQTHTFDLHKIDQETKQPLADATFTLYKYDGGAFRLLESQTTGEDGRVSFQDIETATLYKLVETETPDGYGVVTKEFCMRLAPGTHAVSLEFCDSAGNVIPAPDGITGEYYSGSHHLMLTVENVIGVTLPATGGVGVLQYVLSGWILLLAAITYGFFQKCRRTEN